MVIEQMCLYCGSKDLIEINKHEIKVVKCVHCGKITPVIQECEGDNCKL
jgi:hypothetical protein